MNPWARLEVITDGSVKPCCFFSSPLKDSNGTPYNIQTHTLEEIYFSDDLSDLRQQFLQGIKPDRCRSCWNYEKHGLRSIRQHSQWELNQHQFDIDWHDNRIDNFKSMSMALGNVCNLRCRICGPDQSSAWAAESIQQLPKPERKNSKLYQILQNKSWVYKDLDYWEDFYTMLPYLSELKFVGGEPMLIEKHFEVLEQTIELGHHTHLDLVYNTNGTVYPAHAVDLWSKFKSVTVAFSIDDLGQRFEYQRYGSVWGEVEQNINKYSALKDQLNIKLAVNSTINTMNVFYLDQLLQWFDKIEVEDIRLAVLLYPNSLSISNMTDQAKTSVIQKLQKIKVRSNIQLQVDGIASFIKKSLPSDGSLFLDYTKKIDHIRQQNFSDAHTEMAQLMKYN
jgi:MoaA/NifB/PqqE/SkfB family radical SAM enzyme